MRVKKLNQLVENISGTDDEISDAINEIFESELGLEELTEKETEYLDRRIFKCLCCYSWFYKIEESGNNEVCFWCNDVTINED